MFAVGVLVTDTVVVVLNSAHPPDAFMVLVMKIVPGVAFAGVILPVVLSMVKPDGWMVNVPPLSPVNVTSTGGAPAVLQRLAGLYVIKADGAFVTTTVVVVSNPGQGGDGAIA